MLVDDDAEVTEMYRIGLQRLGFGVEVLSDGESFLKAATANPPDVAVLDWRLPDMDGGGLLERMRRHYRTRWAPVFVLSNYPVTAAGAIDRAFVAGAVAWLEKVKTPPALLATKLGEALSVSREPAARARS